MSITCSDLIALANRLATGKDEVDFRSGISRGYYAAYHHLCAWESQLPVPGSSLGPGGGSHQQLVNRLNNPAPECSPEQKKLSRMLSAMINHAKTKRHAADYDLSETIDQQSAIQSVTEAQRILSK
jgi:hypothetical protein